MHGLRHNTTSPWQWHHCLNNMLVRNLPWCLPLRRGIKVGEWKRGQKPSDASSRAALGFKGKPQALWQRTTADYVTEGAGLLTEPPCSLGAFSWARAEEDKDAWESWGREGEAREREGKRKIQREQGVHGGRFVHTSGRQARSHPQGAFLCLG